jgi:hypothetical protein
MAGRELQLRDLDGAVPTGVAFGFDTVWVAVSDGRLFGLDPEDGAEPKIIQLPGSPAGVTVVANRVLVSSDNGTALFIVNPNQEHPKVREEAIGTTA